MTTYLGEKAVGVGTVKATVSVGKVITDERTILGDGFSEPLSVNTLLFATSESVAGSAEAIRTEFNNKLKVVDSAIDGQADAIAKTRNDFAVADQAIRADMNAKDSELETILNDHAERLATLRTDHDDLGDDVSDIQAKIPQSASGSNPLITKQQLLDEEMDIRSDLIDIQGELQTQITHQAAEIATKQDALTAGENITIVDNVISSTGGDLSNYLPLSGGIVTGPIIFDTDGFLVFTENGANVGKITGHSFGMGLAAPDGVLQAAVTNEGLVPVGNRPLGKSANRWTVVYAEKLNNGEDLVLPTQGGTLARLEDITSAIGDIETALSEI